MIETEQFVSALRHQGFDLFCGVPDSLLADLCTCIEDNSASCSHIITANEGNAIALAAGHYLAGGRPALVYMQNSGLGNCVNPLLSLTDEAVYRIPVLMIIGWRGEPGRHDEPQHLAQGRLTLPLLETLGIRYELLDNIQQLVTACNYMSGTLRPLALVVRKNTFTRYARRQPPAAQLSDLTREDAIRQLLQLMDDRDIVIATTGMISRELYASRTSHERDFLCVGSMGHASSIALGIALRQPTVKVFCFDGDGSFIMHMGSAAVNGMHAPDNFRHIILNNAAHDSVGGLPTVASGISLSEVAKVCGYAVCHEAETAADISAAWDSFYHAPGSSAMCIRVRRGARADLGRPQETPVHSKELFMQHMAALCRNF